MGFKPTSEDWALFVIIMICLLTVGFCLSMVFGCVPIESIKPIIPTPVVIEEPEPLPDPRPTPIISVEGPIIVGDLARCMSVPPDIVCSLTGDFGDMVHCISPCGIIVCIPGQVILCPSTGLCYTADP